MSVRVNQLKSMLLAKQKCFGFFHSMGSVVSAEILAHSDSDWIVLDGEHSTNDLITLRDQMITLDTTNMPIAVRVVKGQAHRMKQLLDSGAQTLLVPMVESAEEAEYLVRAMRYPPHGIRGVAGAVRASNYGYCDDYLATANEQVCLIAQVETRNALSHVDAISAVEGVDCVFIGPSDLSADMGHLGNPGHPEVQEAVKDAMERIQKAGKAVGIFASSPESAQSYFDMGATLVAAGTDIGIYVQGIKSTTKAYRQLTSDT